MAHEAPDAEDETEMDAAARWRAAIPFVCLVLALALFFAAGGEEWLSAATVRQYQDELLAWRDAHPGLAFLGFVALVTACTTISVPSGALLPVMGGFLFGPWAGTAAHVAGAVMGAVLLVAAARVPLGQVMTRKSGASGQRILAWVRAQGFATVLALRLIPFVPPVVPSLIAAVAQLNLPTLALATALGALPGTILLSLAGAGGATALVTAGPEGFGLAWPAGVALTLLGLVILASAFLRSRRAP